MKIVKTCKNTFGHEILRFSGQSGPQGRRSRVSISAVAGLYLDKKRAGQQRETVARAPFQPQKKEHSRSSAEVPGVIAARKFCRFGVAFLLYPGLQLKLAVTQQIGTAAA